MEPDIFEAFGFYTVNELTEEERQPPEFLIEGLVPVGITFLSGAPKIRKSYLALQMAIAVATGSPFLGRKTHRCQVAYLDLEGSKSRISARTERMSTRIPRQVRITNAIPSRLADRLVEDLRTLHRREPELRFFIIDTFSRARGNVRGGGANAYDQDVALLEPVQRMAVEENIALLFVHHDKKGAALASDSFERLSGTMGISGSADCVINLVAQGKRFDGRATMEFNPRDARGGELQLVFDPAYGEWMEEVQTTPDPMGNPLCRWIVEHAPPPKAEGRFVPYADLCQEAYHSYVDNPGARVLEELMPRREMLFSMYGIGVQFGVKSNGKRGARIVNLQ